MGAAAAQARAPAARMRTCACTCAHAHVRTPGGRTCVLYPVRAHACRRVVVWAQAGEEIVGCHVPGCNYKTTHMRYMCAPGPASRFESGCLETRIGIRPSAQTGPCGAWAGLLAGNTCAIAGHDCVRLARIAAACGMCAYAHGRGRGDSRREHMRNVHSARRPHMCSWPGCDYASVSSGPSGPQNAPWSLRRALVMPQANTGSRYRCGKRFLVLGPKFCPFQ